MGKGLGLGNEVVCGTTDYSTQLQRYSFDIYGTCVHMYTCSSYMSCICVQLMFFDDLLISVEHMTYIYKKNTLWCTCVHIHNIHDTRVLYMMYVATIYCTINVLKNKCITISHHRVPITFAPPGTNLTIFFARNGIQ